MKGEGPISLYKGIASLHDASGPGSLTFILGQLALIVHCDFLRNERNVHEICELEAPTILWRTAYSDNLLARTSIAVSNSPFCLLWLLRRVFHTLFHSACS